MLKTNAVPERRRVKEPTSLRRTMTPVGLAPAALLLSACAGPREMPQDLVKSLVAPPVEFRSTPDELQFSTVDDGWLDRFDSRTLRNLVDEALTRNPTLAQASAVRDQARESVRLARAALLPRLSGFANTFRDQDSRRFEDTLNLELEASWEVDIWGRARASLQSSEQAAMATELEYEYLRQSLAAVVARALFVAIIAQEQVNIDRERLTSERSTADVTARRAEAGIGLPLDADIALANVANARESLLASEYALQESLRALEALLGRYPSAELAIDRELPMLPSLEGVGIPSQLLERRPDLRAAEARVAAAFFRTESQKLARLPRLTLGASVGALFNPAETIWSIAADVFVPLFTGREISAQIDIATAQQRQTMAAYINLAIEAFTEVESALAAERFLRIREEQLTIVVDRFTSASRIAEERYEAGVLTIFELNQVRQNLFNSRSQLLAVRLERYRSRVDVYLALGGDFESPTRPPGAEILQGDDRDATEATDE